MAFTNTRQELYELVDKLESVGCEIVIFGGWSAEILGTKEPWNHKDVDLLIIASSFNNLAKYADDNEWRLRKSWSHKKAYKLDEVLIEFFLVKRNGEDYITEFISKEDSYTLKWPNPLFALVENYKVATRAASSKYEKEHYSIHHHRHWK